MPRPSRQESNRPGRITPRTAPPTPPVSDAAALSAYRRANFFVVVAPDRHASEPDEMVVSISHNGYQTNCISLTPDEADAVVEALRRYRALGKMTRETVAK